MNDQYGKLVSVLMTAWNREKYIAEAIESVLASTYTNFELIIVDDCSTDNTVKIARSYEAKDDRVKVYVNEKNLGDYPNRNRAASYAKGKYIKYLDSDDMIYPHGLDVMVKSMEMFPDAGFGLASKPEDNRCYPVCIAPAQIYLEHFGGFGHFDRAPGSSIINRDAFLNEGGFSGERMVGDLELWLRLAKHYSMVKFPFDLYWNRLHDGQEYQSEYAKRIYPKRTVQLIEEAIYASDCPLTSFEKNLVIEKMRSKRKKENLLKTLKKIASVFQYSLKKDE
ncbi:MAG: glycosyltransferase family 2 protein [Chitinophagaceae bacterium]|nr:glycosyltransferase family 2 protein [Chitinophagaceae bacterium]